MTLGHPFHHSPSTAVLARVGRLIVFLLLALMAYQIMVQSTPSV